MATHRVLAHGINEQPISMRVLKRVIVPLLMVHLVLVTWSGCRAIFQVFSLELHVADRTLRPGSTLGFDATTSGRTYATVRLVMIQGARAETLNVTPVAKHTNPSYDPRTKKAAASVTLTPEVLSRFTPGPAVVRAIAIGGPQWLRTPPPTVRETPVTIQP